MNLKVAYYESHHSLSVKFPHYIDIYERYFKRFQERPVNVVEIGVGTGGFMQVLKRYFAHPDSKILGVDASTGNLDKSLTQDVIVGLQQDEKIRNRVKERMPEIDILIDDGGHLPEEQLPTFNHFMPLIKTPGLYIVEDIQLSYAPKYGGLGKPGTFIEFVKDRIDDVNKYFFEPNDRKAIPEMMGIVSISVYPNIVIFEKQNFKLESAVRVGRRIIN